MRKVFTRDLLCFSALLKKGKSGLLDLCKAPFHPASPFAAGPVTVPKIISHCLDSPAVLFGSPISFSENMAFAVVCAVVLGNRDSVGGRVQASKYMALLDSLLIEFSATLILI